MPKDTFYNLTEDKRHLIETTALDEFAAYGFDKASINRIVATAGIAKGSFYQYFVDKGDLYKHIMVRIGEEKLKYITPVMQNPSDQDFFTLLGEIFRVGLAFAKDNPIAYYGSLLDLAISHGEIDPDIDKKFISHLLIRLQVASFDYFFAEGNEGDSDPEKWADNIMPTVKKMIDFIRCGIQSQQGISSDD